MDIFEGSVANLCLTRIEWQDILFSERPLRPDLLKLERSWPCKEFRLNVQRNSSFELVATHTMVQSIQEQE